MSDATNFLSRNILNALFGRGSDDFGGFASAPDLHLGASTSTPTQAGANFTEPGAGVSYARVDITASDFVNATLADPSLITTGAAVTFPEASGVGWGTITHVGIFDALTGGNLLIILPLTVSRTVNDGDTLSFAAGEIDINLT